MRLHHLSITAFGPFAETVEVDFDELSEPGLFLLTGATGAGKTSVLDAVCFALYGQVPGDRSGAKHLRSDHAAARVAPEVALRFSVGEREFLFRRSPAWSRPKLRGQGETRVQAHVLVEELTPSGWSVLANRLDDAGLLVTRLLGMTCTQFTQVALLPQGRFQAFLRATSAERHAVLQQLFRTDRFERVEQWLVERRGVARKASTAHGETVLASLNRLREAAGDNAEPVGDDLEEAVRSGAVQTWMADLRTAAEHAATTTAEAALSTEEARADAETVLAGSRRTLLEQQRGRAAQDEIARLSEQLPAVDEQRQVLAAHRRATPLAGLVAHHATAARAAAAADDAWERHQAALVEEIGTALSAEQLDTERRRAAQAHTLALAFGPRAQAARTARQRLATARQRLQTLEATVAELDLTIADQPAVLADAVAAVHEARAAAARFPHVAAQVAHLEDLLVADRRAELVGLELAAARTDVLAATEAAQAAREHYLDLREARISGMAGELAGQLASGCSCPVCGSAEHPAPASTGSASVGRAQEDQARKAAEDASFELQTRQVALGTLEGELAALDERLTDVDRAGLAEQLGAARDDAERLEPLVSALEVLVSREAACRSALRTAEESRSAALLEHASLRTEITQHQELLDEVAREWEALLTVPGATAQEDGTDDLDVLVVRRAARVALLERAAADQHAWQQAVRTAEEAASALANAAERAGFPDVDAAVDALLSDEEAAATEAAISAVDGGLQRARSTLADPDVAVALTTPTPDLAADEARYAARLAAAKAAGSAHDAARTRAARITELVGTTEQRISAWAPLQRDHRTVAELASLVEGKSADNPLRMRLAAYVLAERLRQVVDAANERLARMTDQRYALEHSDDRGYGEQRGGLSLRVRDDWNGILRDPATLSGGETFVVSLSLALGLADTVAHEAGGTDIDTLFIDEGFGSLDADTLEDVMDTLDSLRDGGRVVGLVSHVPELRSRISTQLQVVKNRAGSTLRTTVAPA